MPAGTHPALPAEAAADALAAFAAWPPAALSRRLRNEYPQTAALFLDRLPEALAATVLAALPTSFAAEVAARMLRLEAVRPDIAALVAEALAADLLPASGADDPDARQARTAAVLRSAPDVAAAVIERIGPARALDLGIVPPPADGGKPRLRVPCGRRRVAPVKAAPRHPAPRPAAHSASMNAILADIRRLITTGENAQPADATDLAAEWAALAEGAPAAPSTPHAPPSTRVLDQDEIDDLLGFNHLPPAADGLLALAGSPRPHLDRLPAVEPVLDRFGQALTATLRALLDHEVEISIDQISDARYGDYINAVPLPAMFGLFRAEEWDGPGLAVADSALVYSLVDVLLGGRRGTAAMRIEGRPYTRVERTLVAHVFGALLRDLAGAFAPIAPVTMPLDRLETNPRHTPVERPGGAVLLVKLRIDLEDRGGRLELVLPHATIEPVRELLARAWTDERSGRSALWRAHIEQTLAAAPAGAVALLGERRAALADVLAWRVGATVAFPGPAAPLEATLRMPGLAVAQGAVLQRQGRLALRADRLLLAGDRPPPPPDAPFQPRTRTGDDAMPQTAPTAPALDLGALGQAGVTVSAVLGEAELTVAQLLALGRGAVIELGRAVGEPLDILVNGTPFARGDVAIVEDRVAVVLTELRARPGE